MIPEAPMSEVLPTPEIDREYVEIYPINWSEVSQQRIKDIFTSRSKEGISEISLYLHIPFCPTLCPFCKFNILKYDNSTYKDYVGALRSELSLYKDHPDLEGRKVTAVYFGGGTGSMLKPKDMALILDDVGQAFPLSGDAEITVESHPNTVDRRRFQEYASIGVNRVSIGIQSFQDANLIAIGRNHSAKRNREVLTAALNIGFNSVAMDLMYRLPNQTVENLLSDLEAIKEFQPHGVSAYSLGIEGTRLDGKLPEIATDEVDKQFFIMSEIS